MATYAGYALEIATVNNGNIKQTRGQRNYSLDAIRIQDKFYFARPLSQRNRCSSIHLFHKQTLKTNFKLLFTRSIF
jgi:hypothetical protein